MADALRTITEALAKLTPLPWHCAIAEDPELANIEAGHIDVAYELTDDNADGIVVILNALPALLEDYRRLHERLDVLEVPALNYNKTLARAEKAEAERDALRERWARLKAWAKEQHRLSMGASRLVEVSDVVQKMGELEAPDA